MNSDSNSAQRWSLRGVLMATSALPFVLTPAMAQAQTAATTAGAAQDAEPEAPTGAPDGEVGDDNANTIVVTGIRRALETARNIKRNSDTFVDSITASDVSTLPDLSVAEALGRVPGVTVSRFPSGGSPDFPSPEGRGNLIRGLGFIRSEFNGRDAFTANAGRALDWSSIPPELVGAVDVFKNQSADLIEGGIGGTINLRTLEPFDRKDRFLAAALDFTYSDLRKSWSPSGSLTIGDRWQTGAGEFGLMLSYSKSLLDSRIHGWQQPPPQPRVLGPNGIIPFANQFGGTNRLNEFAGVDPSRIVATTAGFQMRTNDFDRDRTSYYGAGQWRSNDQRIKVTGKFVRARTDIDSIERTLETWPERNTSPTMQITDLVVNPNFKSAGTPLCNGEGGLPANPGDCETLIPVGGGLMESGLVTSNEHTWTGISGFEVDALGVGKKETATTQDISLNVQWELTDRLTASLDGHKTKASARMRQLWAGVSSHYNYRINHDLDDPTVEFLLPAGNIFDPGFTRTPNDTAANPIPARTSSDDPNAWFLNYASEFYQEGTGDLYAVRSDFNYDMSDTNSWFNAVKFGARYSERSQANREFGDNWGAIAPAWGGGYGVVGTFQDPSFTESVDFKDFFRGGVLQGPHTQFRFVNDKYLNDYSAFRDYLAAEPQTNPWGGNWVPRLEADGSAWGRANFLPEHISDITEKTRNAYVRVDFGNEFGDNGMSIDGNVGVRYVRTDLTSSGFQSYRPWSADLVQPEFDPVTGRRLRTPDAESRDDPRDFLPQAALYTMQAATEIDFKTKDTFWLPSLNVKWNLNPEMLIRFGASKGLSRPEIQTLRAAQLYSISTTRLSFPAITDPTDPLFGVDRGAQNITVNQIRVGGGNPRLEPTTAWNYDLSYEYYFKGGYLSVAGFLKKLKNIQGNGELPLGSATLDGVEVPIIYAGTVNQAEATVKGIEIGYQQFYDFLPGILSNFGTQANYTFIDASATPPSGAIDVDGDGALDGGMLQQYRYGVDDLLGQSRHIANAVGIYQDDKLELRLAYNWRSKYLTTYRDYITGGPVFVSAAGFLDASAKYQFTPQLQVRASVANLLDTKSKARAQIDPSGQMYDRFSFLNDRRFVLGVLAQF